METFPELLRLRQAIHSLLNEMDDVNNNRTVESRGASLVRSSAANDVCSAVEACMHHGLKRVSSKECVSLWGLLQWTNIEQQKRYRKWKQEEQEKHEVVDELCHEDWYNDLFKEELQNIKFSPFTIHSDNQTEHDSSTCSSNTDCSSSNPMTPGFNASIRTANSLLHVKSPEGKVRAWIRQCCNTHILSACLASNPTHT
jgi:hypothetical protein